MQEAASPAGGSPRRSLTQVQLRRAGALGPRQLDDPAPQVLILHQPAAIRRMRQPVSQLALRREEGKGRRAWAAAAAAEPRERRRV